MKNIGTIKIEKAITLIALVITIIVLLILAGVTINLTLGDNGIFKVTEQAVRNYKDAEEKELGLLEQFETELGTNFEYDATKGVNKPKILTGMTPIKFTEPTDTEEAQTVSTNETDESWYNYPNKQWANAQTEDGSMWVWIPKYAYKIDYTDATDKSKGGTIDVVFLIGTTDEYYDENGEKKTAQRATSADEIVDTTEGYTVHPAFTDESSISYANGGWDEELTGIWVAKFEAAYATENNVVQSKIKVPSKVNYTQTQVFAPKVETKTTDAFVTARNHVDGQYGTTTAIKYPTFQGTSYSMNYISINDAYNISRVLTDNNNIYGLNGSNTDSHLMKNSEWGAIAYLTQSKYGLNGTNIFVNNVSLDNTTASVYAVTGCSSVSENEESVTTIQEINDRTATNLYVWTQKEGQKASCTGTVYGIYDLSGGLAELTTGYVANSNDNLKIYGTNIAYVGETLKTISTKYTTVYPYDSSVDNSNETDLDKASTANYAKNTKIYGDAVREISIQGTGSNSKLWYEDYSCFWSLRNPFSIRGGHYMNTTIAGINSFARTSGYASYWHGFRSVLVAK